MTTATYTVEGMTCGHCVASVTSALTQLPGVRDVTVDLDRGQATVTSDAELDTDAVRAAIDDAGYVLAS
jgi:copper ion binding protein